jgi:hypothetical protein
MRHAEPPPSLATTAKVARPDLERLLSCVEAKMMQSSTDRNMRVTSFAHRTRAG